MRELGDLRQTAFLQAYRAGAIGVGGDPARGEALIAESERLLESLGDMSSFEANFVMLVQGRLALMRGDYNRAEEQLERTLTLGRVLDAKGILSAALAFMGELALSRGDVKTAAGHYRKGLVLGWEGDFAVGMTYNLHGLVWLGSRSANLHGPCAWLGHWTPWRGTFKTSRDSLLPRVRMMSRACGKRSERRRSPRRGKPVGPCHWGRRSPRRSHSPTS